MTKTHFLSRRLFSFLFSDVLLLILVVFLGGLPLLVLASLHDLFFVPVLLLLSTGLSWGFLGWLRLRRQRSNPR